MKFQKLNLWRAALLSLLLAACAAPEQYGCDCIENTSMKAARQFFGDVPKGIEIAQATMHDNEFEPSKEGRDAIFYCNPLVLNGKTLDYGNFTIFSKGVLSVAKGDPESASAEKIPFRIYLRREGTILGQGKDSPEVTEIEVSEILMFAQPNDDLIIEPAREKDWKAKRIIRLMDGC